MVHLNSSKQAKSQGKYATRQYNGLHCDLWAYCLFADCGQLSYTVRQMTMPIQMSKTSTKQNKVQLMSLTSRQCQSVLNRIQDWQVWPKPPHYHSPKTSCFTQMLLTGDSVCASSSPSRRLFCVAPETQQQATRHQSCWRQPRKATWRKNTVKYKLLNIVIPQQTE